MRSLHDPWRLGPLDVPNRVVLAPLAGIGNWFTRLQAKRHGAGMVVSEMVSSFGIHYGDRKTTGEMLRIEPAEKEYAGPVVMQLFGNDADVMRSAAEKTAAAGADAIDLNMGCPVPKVCKTGAGAALLSDPDKAVAIARAAAEGSGLPVTVKLRPGRRPGDRDGVVLAQRLAEEAGVAALSFHPRHASQQHKGLPDYDLAAELVEALAPVPVLISGGLRSAERVHQVFVHTGAAAVLLARGILGNPWLFEEVLGLRTAAPSTDEVLDELAWVIDRAEEHLGAERASRYLKKHYPWYLERLGTARALQDSLLRTASLDEARALLGGLRLAQAA